MTRMMTEEDDVAGVVRQRRETHGDFTEVARVTHDLREVARSGPSWMMMTNVQHEGLSMILHKIARVVCGDPYEPDHWRDIQGYARIVEERLPSRDGGSSP